jgi:hypothetical protein
MAESSKLGVMISSRCKDNFPPGPKGKPLADIRKKLKKEIEGLTIFDQPVFDVWIHEAEPPKGGTWDSTEICLQAVQDCDILIALSNGNAGWAQKEGEIGICHAELMAGISQAPGKVRLIDLGMIALDQTAQGKRNADFQKYLSTQSFFRGKAVLTEGDLVERVKEAVHEALISLARAGVQESSRGRFDRGDALLWSRLDFAARKEEMVKSLCDAMSRRRGASLEDQQVIVRLAGHDILFVPHALPAAFNIGQAKEMVGQPFLRDHHYVNALTGNRGGPVHIIACHKTATEGQAVKLLGFPDATLVTTPFGVFVADNIQKVQFAFIANCRDRWNTFYGVQRFFAWLAQSGEEAFVAARALSRARIVRAIAEESCSQPKIEAAGQPPARKPTFSKS